MVWTAPITWFDGDPLTAAQLNIFNRDNMLATEAGVSTTSGRIITTTDVGQIQESQWARAYKNPTAQLQLDSQWFVTEDEEGNLLGPTVTVQHNGLLWLLFDARVDMDTTNGNAVYAPIVDGDEPQGTRNAVRVGAEGLTRIGGTTLWYGQPGTSEITMGYGVSNSSGSADYRQRRLTVIPF